MTPQPRARTLLTLLAALLPGCGGLPSAEAPGDERPDASRSADYDVFSQRCSKCHPLSRVTSVGAASDAYWARYVSRMRLQPGSGISPEDAAIILRYLRGRPLAAAPSARPAAIWPAPPGEEK
jgi:mono/diheme cytochrome c family protein